MRFPVVSVSRQVVPLMALNEYIDFKAWGTAGGRCRVTFQDWARCGTSSESWPRSTTFSGFPPCPDACAWSVLRILLENGNHLRVPGARPDALA